MLDLTKYALSHEDIEFIDTIRGDLENLNEVLLAYKGEIFCLEPCMGEVGVCTAPDEFVIFKDLDDALIGFEIEGRPLIDIIGDVEFA